MDSDFKIEKIGQKSGICKKICPLLTVSSGFSYCGKKAKD
jgi:hypothetical protein